VEIDAHNGSGVVTLRYSSSGYRTKPGDTPASTLYAAVLIDPGSFERSLFGGKKTLGNGQINFGSIDLANADGALDDLLGYGFDGRTVRILRVASLSDAYSTATVVLRATVQRLDSDAAMSRLRVRLYDRRLELDEPLQTNRYTGETTSGGIVGHLADGTANMKDQPKPLLYGKVFNVQPVTVNPFDLIYQVNDGTVVSIVVMDGRVPLTLTADFATVALLQAATIAPGKYGTCLAAGLFRLGCPAWYTLTANVVQAALTASAIVEAILTRMGLTGGGNIDAASFSAFATLSPQELGIVIDGAQRASEAIGQVLASVGGYLVTAASGPFQVGRGPTLGTPTWTLDENDIEGDFGILSNPDTRQGLPAWRVILRHSRNWTVQTGEMVCPGATADLKSFAESMWREIKDDDASVVTKYPLAEELLIETFLTSDADATTEAARRAGLYGVRRDLIVVAVALDGADAMTPGSTGTVTLDRFGWDAGKDFTVIAREDRLAAGQAILTLWG
ncbi:MAG: hypothetical protein ABIY37_01485, partial [Devosia sp.]